MAEKKTEKKDAAGASKQVPKPNTGSANRDPKPAKKGEAKAIPIDKLNASNDE